MKGKDEDLESKFYELFDGSAVLLTTLPDGSQHTTTASDALSLVKQLSTNRDVHLNVNPRRAGLPASRRGGDDDVDGLAAIVVDMDVTGPTHKDTALPRTKDEAIDFLDSLSIKPSAYVDSGYGIHGYFFFEQVVSLSDPDTRKRVKGILYGFGQMLTSLAAKRGWKQDNVFSLSHMFRAPGSLNRKLDPPVPCNVISLNDNRYVLDDFAPFYAEPQATQPTAFEMDPEKYGSAQRIMDRCVFAQKMLNDPNNVSEPEWKALCDNIALVPDGPKYFHEWSSKHSKYSYDETEKKIQRSQMVKCPETCEYIQKHFSPNCPKEGCGVKAPIVLARLTYKEQIEDLLTKSDLKSDEFLSEKVLKLAAYARDREPTLYVKLKQRVKTAGVGLRDFGRAVQAAAAPIAASAPSSGKAISLNGLDLHGAVAPAGYDVTFSDGITATVATKSGTSKRCLCSQPVVITARLENIDTGKEMLDITFLRNGKWKTVRALRSSLLNKTTLVKYADSGLMVTSDNAGEMVRYFADYESENTNVIPFIRSVGRIGWIGGEFYPYVINGEVVFDGEDGEGILQALVEKGDNATWTEAAMKLRELPFARAIIAASLVSPILHPLQNRIITLHVWCASRSGKTAALKFALSVWGDPMKLTASFNSTVVGIERRAGMLKHLPLGLDELQVLNTRFQSPSTIVYALGNGYGKTRGGKDGGLQEVPKWHNCIISTGEQPLVGENDMDGMRSRVLELYGQPIEDPDLGRRIHQISEENYGFAGKKYLQFLIGQVLSKEGKLQADFADLRNGLSACYDMLDMGDPGPHLDNIAALALADYYSSISLFGLPHDQAREEAVQLGLALLENCKVMKKEDIVDSAWHFVWGWIATERSHFNGDRDPCYGIIESDGVYVIAAALKKTLSDANYNYSKSINGFRDRGYIRTFSNSEGNNNVQCQMRVRGVNARVVCLKTQTAQNEHNE